VDIRRELAASQPDAFRPNLAGSLNNVATMLSDLGRREEALERAQEAVDIRRELAASQPDAFRPDLAMSLSVLADCLEALSRLSDAIGSDEDAIRALGPMFLRSAAPFSRLMDVIVRDYIRRLEALNREPKPEIANLLAKILAVFNSQSRPDQLGKE
jgi:tetratricopeptide (TPR) repeat protein